MSFRRFRILILFGLLAAAGSLTFLEQWIARGWRVPVEVQVFPINGDGSAKTDAMIAALTRRDFDDINAFLERESARYGAKVSPAVNFSVQPVLSERPPAPPRGGNALQNMAWSLKLRWWVYRHADALLPQPGTVKLFLIYHTAKDGVALEHSLGLQKGLIGVIHVFADARQQRQNAIVIAHELLHTLGASDKYEAGGRPVYPDGYANAELPQAVPRREAEIMAGRYLSVAGVPVMPPSLEACVIGPATAREINLDQAFRNRYSS